MKKFKLLMLSIVGLVTACTNESELLEYNSVNLAKPVKVDAYSNGVSVTNLNPTLTKWQWDTKIENWPETSDRGEQVSTSEYNYVIQYLSEHPNEGYDEVDLSTYFLQNVGGSYANYHEPFMNGSSAHHYADITGSNQMDYFEINGVHINDYNASYGSRIYVENLPLVNPRYHDSYASLTIEDKYKFYYIPMEDGTYNLYLCFDYSTKKYDNGQLDFPGDGIYNDWVIKIVPGDGVVNPPSTKEPPTVEEPSDSIPIIPSDTILNHVEINLSVDDQEWLQTHLSIHVRANTNVEVFIPIERQYYVEADDMAIVQKHEIDWMIHGGPKVTEYNINNNIIKLVVTFEETGIRVKTEGINQDVLNYLNGVTGDGLTFEVWNYYNNSLTRDELRDYLEKHLSTVKFTNVPNLYVNAFNKNSEGGIFKYDCTVNPIDTFNNVETGWFFNNSKHNELYYKD